MDSHDFNLDPEGERIRALLMEIGEENAIGAATTLLGAVFHGIDPETHRARMAELTSRLIMVSIHPDGEFCPGVIGPLLEAAAIAMAVVYEGLGFSIDPNGETVTPRYIAEALAGKLAGGDADWSMMQGQAAKIRARLGFTDGDEEDGEDDAEENGDARAFSERYRALSDGSDDDAEDAAVIRDRASIDALNALLGLGDAS